METHDGVSVGTARFLVNHGGFDLLLREVSAASSLLRPVPHVDGLVGIFVGTRTASHRGEGVEVRGCQLGMNNY